MTRGAKRLAAGLWLSGMAAAAYGSLDTLWGPDGLPRRRALQADLARIAAENDALQAQLDQLRREIVAQKERPEVQEALVRDVLGYVRPKEIVLQPRDP